MATVSEKIIAFANQKGGVGKTTSCVNLAASLVAMGERVLLCDIDPQGNATMGSGVDKSLIEVTMNDLLQGDANLTEVILHNTPAGYDLIPANSDLTAAEIGLLKKQNKERQLGDQLNLVREQYDFILIDCPPALNMLTLNALTAADAVIIPMQCEYFALEGLSDLLNTISQLKQTVNPHLQVTGIIRTMFDPRNRLAIEVSDQLIKHFGNKVYQTVIPRNVRLAEAPSHGLPAHLYDKGSRGAAAYMALANEIVKRRDKNHHRQTTNTLSVETID